MKIELITKYYIISEMATISNSSWSTISQIIDNLEITPDLKIDNVKAFSCEKMRKILGYFEFEKEFWEIMYEKQLNVNEIILESSMNYD